MKGGLIAGLVQIAHQAQKTHPLVFGNRVQPGALGGTCRPHLLAAASLSPHPSKPSGKSRGFESLFAHRDQQPGSLTAGGLLIAVGLKGASCAVRPRRRRSD
jgi:hypothetical protein